MDKSREIEHHNTTLYNLEQNSKGKSEQLWK